MVSTTILTPKHGCIITLQKSPNIKPVSMPHKKDITMNIKTNFIQANKTTLASTDSMGMVALYVLCCDSNTTLEAIKVLVDAHPGAMSVKNVGGLTRHLCHQLVF